jgi:serine/threonine-protein kinase
LIVRADLARVYTLLGDWESATRALGPVPSRGAFGHVIVRSRLLMWRRDVHGLEAILRENPDLLTTPSVDLPSASFLRDVANPFTAATLMRRLIGMATEEAPGRIPRRAAFAQQIAAEAAGFGDAVGPLLDHVEGADRYGLFDIVWMDKCPMLECARSDPRFVAVRDRVAARAREVLANLGG